MRKVILYIASSLDGYIAKPGDNLDFLSLVQQEGEDYGYATFTENIDTVIMGRKTYDWVVKQVPYPHTEKKSYIITRTPKPALDNLEFYTGSLKDLVRQLKSEPGSNIFCDGGAELVNALLKDDLIDEMIISIVPVLLGEGIRLFKDGRPEQRLELVASQTFDTGLVQLHFCRAEP